MSNIIFFGSLCDAVKKDATDEMDLIRLVQEGTDLESQNAMEQLIVRNYKLIISVARKFTYREAEILSACIEGFMQSVYEYKSDMRQYKLSTIAVRRMTEKAMETIAKLQKPISYNRTAYYRIKKVGAMMEAQKSVAEIAQALNLSEKAVIEFMRRYKQYNSFCGEQTLETVFAEDGKDDRLPSMYKAIAQLPLKKRQIMLLASQGVALKDIALKLGLKESTVKSSYYKTLRELKQMMIDMDQMAA